MTSLRMNSFDIARSARGHCLRDRQPAPRWRRKAPAAAWERQAISHRLAMAILVYGISAIVVGAGLIGAVRGR